MTQQTSPLDIELGEDEDLVIVSKTDQLLHYMASLGFTPKEPRGKGTMEFAKVLSNADGRACRVVAVIQKDEVGLEPKRADYFTVTVQMHVPANEESVAKKAPAFAKQDLLRILAHFDVPDARREAETITCELCAGTTAEFTERADGAKVCPDCARRKGLNQ